MIVPVLKKKELGVAALWQSNCQNVWRVQREVMKKEVRKAWVATPGTPWKEDTGS
jgi:hypothetical protein